MKKSFPLLSYLPVIIFSFFSLLSLDASAQTGTGVILLTGPTYTFTPTTVNDTAVFALQLVNTVAIEQSIFFGGLQAPFTLSNNAPQLVAASDTLSLSISFIPSQIGAFTDTLDVVGTIFGTASLIVSGDGIQVQLTWSPPSLDFPTTAIGQQSTSTLSLSSVGDGTAVISSLVFSNGIFNYDTLNSSLSIAQGTSGDIIFTFAPINAGIFSETVTLTTNDPNNTEIVIPLNAMGISEVSGEICDMVWTLDNSPYTLVGDIVIPTGCTLTVEAGVIIQGDSLDIEVFGSFFSNGTLASPVTITLGEFISHSPSQNVVLNHTQLTEVNEVLFLDMDYRIFRDANSYSQDSLAYFLDSLFGNINYLNLYNNENTPNHLGKYVENFDDNNCQGWEMTNEGFMCPTVTNQSCFGNSSHSVYDGCNYNQWGWLFTSTPIFTLNSGELPTSMSFLMNTYNDNWGYDATVIDYLIQYSLDGGSWYDLENSSSYLDYATRTFNLTELSPQSTIQFRFGGHFQYYGTLLIDNFVLLTDFYLGIDITTTAALIAVQTATFSTGGLELHNSQFTGDFLSVSDSINVVLDNSQIIGNASRNKDSHGLGLYADYVNVTMTNSTISGHSLDGMHIEATISDATMDGCDISSNGTEGVKVNGDLNLDANTCSFDGNGTDGIDAGANSTLSIYGCNITNNGARGVAGATGSVLDFNYVLIDDNIAAGIDIEGVGSLTLNNTRLRGNGGSGIESASPVTLNYCDIAFSGGTGIALTGNNFHTLNNSVLWGNNSSNYTQIDIGGGVISTSYTTVQGRSSYGTTGVGQYYWGEGVIEADPLFADTELHLETFSPCVDGGQPWHQDTNMPFGLGGVRADMGIYGGPDNAYWGGNILPDGASALTVVSDSPQDQGGIVGLVFDASFYDNNDLVNNVTHYAFWRHYDPTGTSIATLDEGSWELVGEMPALNFNGYAFQAQTLGNTNVWGTFNSCFTVVAHTADENTYWYSNVMCGESQDNLAPVVPVIQGIVLGTGEVQIMWTTPTEDDYAYTEVTSDAGYLSEISGDTLTIDPNVSLGNLYTYTAVHYDVNGNASDPSSVTISLEAGYDEIVLHAGWNLISTDRIPTNANIDVLFSGLISGNLQYVTGFNSGVQFYDPNGMSFLNSLNALDNGYGYWVKVLQDDVLQISGINLSAGYVPPLNEGWNLVGYSDILPAAPEVAFEGLYLDGNLLYVTGFDQGVQVYDPLGLPFLNTLTELRNGFGYWVKSAVAVSGGVLSPTVEDNPSSPNPSYAILNGVSNLGLFVGEYIDVIDPSGNTVSRLEILPDGYIMTGAVYGNDPSLLYPNGLSKGETLRFVFRGSIAESTHTFNGDMEHIKLNLHFNDVESVLSVFPNPVSTISTISFELSKKSLNATLELVDIQGRVIKTLHEGATSKGLHSIEYDASELATGTYALRLTVDGSMVSTERIVKTK